MWLDGRVVMQRPAKPFTPVRFRLQPPFCSKKIDKQAYKKKFLLKSMQNMKSCIIICIKTRMFIKNEK